MKVWNGELEIIAEYIHQADTISVIPHVSADGDSIGAAFSLKMALETMGKAVTVYLEEEIQNRYLFAIQDIEYTVISSNEDTDKISSDLAIAVDCADQKRLGNRISIFNNAKRTVLIDHHMFNEGFADINYIDTRWAAAVIGVYYLIKELKIQINYNIATLIYIALVTDTGGFRHSNTNPESHIIASELLGYNISPQLISMNVFDNITYGRYMLSGEIIKRTEFFFDGKVCVCYLPEKSFEKHGAVEEDGEGIADYLRNIEGVEVGVYVKDKGDTLKISMRAKNYVDVATVAAVFSGGGHIRASGASWNGDYKSLKEKLLKELEAVIDESDKSF